MTPVSDDDCAAMVKQAIGQLSASGMTEPQIRDALLGAALGLATTHGWSPDDIGRVAREYAETFERAYQAQKAPPGGGIVGSS